MDDPNPPADAFAGPFDAAQALQNVTLYGILPVWLAAGFLDYLYHRKSSIQTTSGTHESMIHALQMTAAGIPTLMGLLLDVNAAVIGTMIAATATHEALTFWDIGYTEPLRRPEPGEQHTHGFLEVVPIMALMSTLSLHPRQTAALFGRGDEPARWSFRFKEPPLSRRYLAGVFAAILVLGVIPYTEEFVRCLRTDRTLAPHVPPEAD